MAVAPLSTSSFWSSTLARLARHHPERKKGAPAATAHAWMNRARTRRRAAPFSSASKTRPVTGTITALSTNNQPCPGQRHPQDVETYYVSSRFLSTRHHYSG